jgi:hypothetical protein
MTEESARLLADILGPWVGSADTDAPRDFRNVNVNDERQLRVVLRKDIVPYLATLPRARYEECRDFISRACNRQEAVNVRSVFESYLIDVDRPSDEHRFLCAVQSECFR